MTRTRKATAGIVATGLALLMAPGLVGAEKAARGKTPTDTWWHTIVSPTGKEKTGYPTQKPEELLERMILASSNEGDVVLDPTDNKYYGVKGDVETATVGTAPSANLAQWQTATKGGSSAQGSADQVASGNDASDDEPGYKSVLMGSSAPAAPAWVSGTEYAAGKIVVFSGTHYRAKIDITGTATGQDPAANTAGGNNFINQPNVEDESERYLGRFDFRLTDNDNLFARYIYSDRFRYVPGWFGGVLDGTSTSAWGRNFLKSHGAVAGWTKVRGSALVNESRFSWARGLNAGTQDPFGQDGNAQIGFRGVPNDPRVVGGIVGVDISGHIRLGSPNFMPKFQHTDQFQYLNTLTWLKGRHQWKFGADVMLPMRNEYFDVAPTRVISGPRSLVSAPTGLALDRINSELWVANMGNYTETYGVLGAAMILMLWFYISGLVILVGAEMNAEIEHASPYGKEEGEKVPGEKRKIGPARMRAWLAARHKGKKAPSADELKDALAGVPTRPARPAPANWPPGNVVAMQPYRLQLPPARRFSDWLIGLGVV